MSDWIKKELVLTVKWSWLLAFAAFSFYQVVPKYEFKPGGYRANVVTGVIYEAPDSQKNDPLGRKGGFWILENGK